MASYLQFDGNDFVDIQYTEGQTKITHEFWFKTTDGNTGLFSVSNSGPGAPYDRSIYIRGGKLSAYVYGEDKTQQRITSTSTYNDGQWHHVAHVIDDSNGQKLYVDGQLIVTGTHKKSGFTSGGRITLGYAPDGDDGSYHWYKGAMDEIRIWSVARTAEQIKDNYLKQLTGAEDGLVAYYKADDGSGTTLKNISTTANTKPSSATLKGSLTWVSHPTVSLTLDKASKPENESPVFTITGNNIPSEGLDVFYQISPGTDLTSADYNSTSLTGKVKLTSTNSSQQIPITIINDQLEEKNEEITVTILPNGHNYDITDQSKLYTILANDSTVTLNPATNTINNTTTIINTITEETTDTTIAKLTINPVLQSDTEVLLTYSDKTDIENQPLKVTIPAHQTSIDIKLKANDDLIYDPDETVTISLQNDKNYNSDGSSVTFTIKDNEPLVSIEKIQDPIEGKQHGMFKVSFDKKPQFQELKEGKFELYLDLPKVDSTSFSGGKANRGKQAGTESNLDYKLYYSYQVDLKDNIYQVQDTNRKYFEDKADKITITDTDWKNLKTETINQEVRYYLIIGTELFNDTLYEDSSKETITIGLKDNVNGNLSDGYGIDKNKNNRDKSDNIVTATAQIQDNEPTVSLGKVVNISEGFGNGSTLVNLESALKFTGTNYVQIPANNSLDLSQTGQFTQEAWIFSNAQDNNYHGILGYDPETNSINPKYRYPGIWLYEKTGISFGFGDGENWKYKNVSTVLNPNQWNHVATTFDGNEYRLYVNGNLVYNTLQFAGKKPYSTSKLNIGEAGGYKFQGLIDEVRVWNVARTYQEIQNSLIEPLKGDENGLVGYWQFNNNTLDTSVNNNHGTLNGTADYVNNPIPQIGYVEVNLDKPVHNAIGLWVRYDLSGNATQNSDYFASQVRRSTGEQPFNGIIIPNKEESGKIYFTAIPDAIKEGNETVNITLKPYNFDGQNSVITTVKEENIFVSSTVSPFGQEKDKAFDQNTNTKWLIFEKTGWIGYKLDNPEIITEYSITSAEDVPGRDPKNWQLKGSTDGINWVDLDSRSDQTFLNRNTTNTYQINNSISYQYYAFQINENNGDSYLQVADFKLLKYGVFGDQNNSNYLVDTTKQTATITINDNTLFQPGFIVKNQAGELVINSKDITKINPVTPISQTPLFDLTNIPGSVSVSNPNSSISQTVEKAFDDNKSTSWLLNENKGKGFIQYKFDSKEGYIVTQYNLTVPVTVAISESQNNRIFDPKNWVLQGSRDSVNWVNLDERKDQSFTSSETKNFTVNNLDPYQYYRLNITGNNGGSQLQLSEFQLIGPNTPTYQPITEKTFDFTIELSSQPKNDVTVTLTNSTGINLSEKSFTIKATEWDQPHLITVDKVTQDGKITATFSSSDTEYNKTVDIPFTAQEKLPVFQVTEGNIKEQEIIPLIRVTPINKTINEGAGENGQFLIELSDPAPKNGLNLLYTMGGTANRGTDYQLLEENLGSLTINEGENSAIIAFNVLNDALDENKENITINLQTNGQNYILDNVYKSSVIDIVDDDTAGFDIINVSDFVNEKGETEEVFGAKVDSLITSEAGIKQTFAVRLNSQPTADVTLTFEGINNNESNFSLTSLTFTKDNWNQYQKVTVTGKDDAIKDGDITYKVTLKSVSNDPLYQGTPGNIITIINQDNDSDFIPIKDFTQIPTQEEKDKILQEETERLKGTITGNINTELGETESTNITFPDSQSVEILPLATLSVTGDLTENGQPLTLTVNLDQAATEDLIIKYDVTGGSAIENIDYKIENKGFALLRQIGEANPFVKINEIDQNNLAMTDVNNDGLIDTIIINKNGSISYYQNNGSQGSPLFSKQTENPFKSIIEGQKIAVGDLNNDGKFDLIFGKNDGTIQYYQHTTDTATPFVELTGTDNPFNSINLGSNITPVLIDWNGDKLLDLILTDSNNQNKYYQNTGQIDKPKYTEKTGNENPLNGITGKPAFADLNRDGKLDVVMGLADGTLKYYENKEGILTEITNVFSGKVYDLGENSQPYFADLNGDNLPELIVINSEGKIASFLNVEGIKIPKDANSATIKIIPLDDKIAENPENIEIQLFAGQGYRLEPEKILVESIKEGNGTTISNSNNNTGIIGYKFNDSQGIIANQYSVTIKDTDNTNDLKKWTFQGSKDGINWVDIDTRENQTFTTENPTKTFSIINTISYQYYRINVTENNGGTSLELPELKLYHYTDNKKDGKLIKMSADLILKDDTDLAKINITPLQTSLNTSETGDYLRYAFALNSQPLEPVTVYVGASRPDEAKISQQPSSVVEKNYGLKFDGKDDYVEVKINEPETNITHEFWFKTTDKNTGLFSIVDGTLGANGHDRHIYLTNGNLGVRVWEVNQPLGEGGILTTGLNLADGKWHHIAHVIGTGGQKVYIDGQLTLTDTRSKSDFDWQSQALIGYSADATNKYFNGEMDEIRIWNVARSEAEIQATMKQQLIGIEPGLQAYYKANEGSGLVLKDVADLAENGTLTNGVTWVENPSLPLTAPDSELFDYLPLEFTPENWNIPQSLTVVGVDDRIDDGDVKYELITTVESEDQKYHKLAVDTVKLTNLDNDFAGVNINLRGDAGNLVEGTTNVFTVTLNSQPVGDVTVTVSPKDDEIILNGQQPRRELVLTFDEKNWDQEQIVRVVAVDDGIVEYSHQSAVNFKVNASIDFENSRAQALKFDGKDDYVEVKIDEPETNITHEFWFKTTDKNTGLFSIVAGELGKDGHDRHIYLKDGNLGVRVWEVNKPLGEILTTTGLNLADGTWHHIAHVIGTGGQRVYIDGVFKWEGSRDSSDFAAQTHALIGYSADATNKYFNGEMDEIRIWNKARTQTEIKDNLNNTLQGDETGLIAYYKANEGSGTILTDAAGTPENGILKNGVEWSTIYTDPVYNNLTIAPLEVKIEDNDLPTAKVVPGWKASELQAAPSGFMIYLSHPAPDRPQDNGIRVNYEIIGGSATYSTNLTTTDYQISGGKIGSVVIAPGDIQNNVLIVPIDDKLVETTKVKVTGKTVNSSYLTLDVTSTVTNSNQPTYSINADQEFTIDGKTVKVLEATELVSTGRVLKFDGKDDHIEINEINQITLDKELTISIWAKSDTEKWNSTGSLISKRDGYILAPFQNTKNLSFYVYANNNWYQTDATLPDNFDIRKWHNYTATYDGKKLSLYADGNLLSNKTLTQELAINNGNASLFIGKDNYTGPDTSNRYFQGEIEQVNIWQKALKETEIKDNLNKILQGDETGLIAYYHANETLGDSLTDLAGKDQNGSLKNGVTVVDSMEGQIKVSIPGDLDTLNNKTGTINGLNLSVINSTVDQKELTLKLSSDLKDKDKNTVPINVIKDTELNFGGGVIAKVNQAQTISQDTEVKLLISGENSSKILTNSEAKISEETVQIKLLPGEGYQLGDEKNEAILGIVDDDVPGVRIIEFGDHTTVIEDQTATFQISLLSEPTTDVTINLVDPNGQILLPNNKLTFTPAKWYELQTITIKGIDDAIAEPGDYHTTFLKYTVTSTDSDYNDFKVADQQINVIDRLIDKEEAIEGVKQGLRSTSEMLNNLQLPLIGSGDGKVPPITEGLDLQVAAAIDSTENLTANKLETILEEALHKFSFDLFGLKVRPFAGVDVKVEMTNDDLRVEFEVANSYNLFDFGLDADLGIPALGLKTEGTISSYFYYDLSLGFGYHKQFGFYVDTEKTGFDAGFKVILGEGVYETDTNGNYYFVGNSDKKNPKNQPVKEYNKLQTSGQFIFIEGKDNLAGKYFWDQNVNGIIDTGEPDVTDRENTIRKYDINKNNRLDGDEGKYDTDGQGYYFEPKLELSNQKYYNNLQSTGEFHFLKDEKGNLFWLTKDKDGNYTQKGTQIETNIAKEILALDLNNNGKLDRNLAATANLWFLQLDVANDPKNPSELAIDFNVHLLDDLTRKITFLDLNGDGKFNYTDSNKNGKFDPGEEEPVGKAKTVEETINGKKTVIQQLIYDSTNTKHQEFAKNNPNNVVKDNNNKIIALKAVGENQQVLTIQEQIIEVFLDVNGNGQLDDFEPSGKGNQVDLTDPNNPKLTFNPDDPKHTKADKDGDKQFDVTPAATDNGQGKYQTYGNIRYFDFNLNGQLDYFEPSTNETTTNPPSFTLKTITGKTNIYYCDTNNNNTQDNNEKNYQLIQVKSTTTGQPDSWYFDINRNGTAETYEKLEQNIATKISNSITTNGGKLLGYTTELEGQFIVIDDGKRLTASEIGKLFTDSNISFTDLIQYNLGGEANLGLEMEANIEGDAAFPSISTNLAINYPLFNYGNQEEAKEKKFTLEFNDVTLDLGSFITDFAKPIFDSLNDLFEPLRPVVDVLNTDTGFLIQLFPKYDDQTQGGNGDGQLTLIEFFSGVSKDPQFKPLIEPLLKQSNTTYEQFQNGVKTAKNVIDLFTKVDKIVKDIAAFEDGENITINLGDYNLTDIKGASTSPENSTQTGTTTKPATPKDDPINKVNNSTTPTGNILSSLQSIEGLKFEFLNNPITILRILLGEKDVDLVTYDVPDLNVTFPFTTGEKPLFYIAPPGLEVTGRFDASITAKTNLFVGFDTHGLELWSEDNFNAGDVYKIFDGFYLRDGIDLNNDHILQPSEDTDEFNLSAMAKLSIALNAYIAKIIGYGGLDGKAGLDIVDGGERNGTADGKIRFSEVGEKLANAFSGEYGNNVGYILSQFIDLTGQLEAFFGIEVKVGISFFGLEIMTTVYKDELGRYTLFEFDLADLFADDGPTQKATPQNPKGTAGNDTLNGGLGADFINGGDGHDTINGQDGNDNLIGAKGNDILNGGNGNDTLNGDLGKDILNGDSGDDLLIGGDEDDTINGGNGNDQLTGNSGNDSLDGGEGSDQLDGGSGNDNLFGDQGNDKLLGGEGNDILTGGSGDDILTGGSGDDIFRFVSKTDNGYDTITDFTKGDKIYLASSVFSPQGKLTYNNGILAYDNTSLAFIQGNPSLDLTNITGDVVFF